MGAFFAKTCFENFDKSLPLAYLVLGIAASADDMAILERLAGIEAGRNAVTGAAPKMSDQSIPEAARSSTEEGRYEVSSKLPDLLH